MRRGVSGQEQRDKAIGTGREGKGQGGQCRYGVNWRDVEPIYTVLYRIIPCWIRSH
jgi:hypothetical protein